MASECFSVEAMVGSYHVYKDMWDTAVGEQLHCKRELGNRQDPFTVVVVRSVVTVSHIPKKISSVCSMFLRWGGAIKCKVMASKCYSKDLWGAVCQINGL